MNKTEIQKRLKEALYLADMTQTDLANKTGVSKATISNYISGKYEPRQENLIILAEALSVSPAWLAGYEDNKDEQQQVIPGARPIEKRRIPQLGSIACGPPTYAEPNHVETYREAPADIDADYCVVAHGNSMIGVDIREGDIIYVKSQDIVENGQIAVVCIGDETTLKRFYYDKKRSVVQLLPENNNVKPIIKTGAEIDEVRVQGLVVGIYRDLSQIHDIEQQ